MHCQGVVKTAADAGRKDDCHLPAGIGAYQFSDGSLS